MPFDDEDPFETITKRAVKAREIQARRDLGDEQSGRSTGRQLRFFPRADDGSLASKRRRDRDAALMTALELLLATDPIYAAAYSEALRTLSKAEAAVAAAIDETRVALSKAEAALDELRDRASRTPDGTRVFRRADGAIVGEDGRIVSESEAEGVLWREDAPSYEAYLKAKAAAEEARLTLAALELYQVDALGRWRHRLEDEDDPPSLEELQGLQDLLMETAPGALKPPLEASFDRATPAATLQTKAESDAATPAARSDRIELPKL